MWIKTSTMSFIDNEELIEAGIDLADNNAIMDYFYGEGAEESFHDHGLDFEIVNRANFR